MFESITVIGCGLIGSSIVRAVIKKDISKNIYIYDKSKKVLKFLKKENLKINISNNLANSVKNSDLTIIAAPLGAYKEILEDIKNNLKKGSILTDTGSAKKEINKTIASLKLKDISWIASHPIAGTEDSGPAAGFDKLFDKRWCIISPSISAEKKDIKKIKFFWKLLGSKVKEMSFEEHDHILSLTSHLPHAIAYNIVRTAINNSDKFRQDVIQYSAGGLRDFTRIASSNPVMWRDIFIDNSDNILNVLDNFSKNLDELKNAIKQKDGEKLTKIFSSTKDVRKEIVEAGQDTKQPDFGRKKN